VAKRIKRNKEDNPVYQAVVKALETIDSFLAGAKLDGHALPPPVFREAVTNLLSKKKYSTSVRVACLYFVFYKVVKPEYTLERIPVASRGKEGDKYLGANLKDRHIVLGDATAWGENIGMKGDQGNFVLDTDARFKDFILVVREANQEDIEKTALFMASMFAASQAVPPILPALSDDTLSFVRAKALFKTLVTTESGGFIQQFLIAALLKVLRTKQNIQVKTHNPNAADKYDRTAGDIEEFVEGKLLRAYEVTVRPDWKNRLPDFRAKMDKAGLHKYIIIASNVNNDDELREPAAMALKLNPVQRDLAVVDIMDFLTVMAAELSALELRAAINETYEFLVNPTLGGKQQYTTAYTDAVGAWMDTAAA
jgi:hypothetical protein